MQGLHLSPLEPQLFPKRRPNMKLQFYGFCVRRDWVERVPTTLRPLQDLGEVTAGTAPFSPDSIHSGAQGAPKSWRGAFSTLTACPFLSPNPLKQTSSLLSRKESQAALHFCQHGFNWRRSLEPDLDSVQLRARPPFWKRPLLFSHFQPASRLLFQQSSSPGLSGLLRHQSLVRAGSNLHSIPFTS